MPRRVNWALSSFSSWRREFTIGAALTVLLWIMALVLWSAQDIASGNRLSDGLKLLMAMTFAVGLCFSAGLAAVIVLARRLPKPAMIAATALLTIGIALLHGLIDAYMLKMLSPALGIKPMPLAELFNRGLMPFVLIYGLYAVALGLMLSEKAMRDSERRLAEARSAAQSAELAALRFQLNPHFLFNTLNAISSLIVTGRNAEADRMTMKLSDFLRLTLEADPETEVTLDEELATTQSYLDIEAVRFGERLDVVFECPADLLDACVPSFLLQPIVENSIKYAVLPSRRPVTLAVRVGRAGDMLRLLVEDDGGQAFGGTGVGLRNVRRRLAAFYGDKGELDATATDRGFAVVLTLPLRLATLAEAA